jgi:hypothetical protein
MPTDTDLSEVWNVAERARGHGKLSHADTMFIRDRIPAALKDVRVAALPKSLKHPGGFTVTGASVGTFLRSALLLAGQKALGKRFDGSPFYEQVEQDLAFGIMRSHFHLSYPKGAHCCGPCTLAVYPVLAAGAIRYFDNAVLAKAIERMVAERQWRFAGAANERMVSWSLR